MQQNYANMNFQQFQPQSQPNQPNQQQQQQFQAHPGIMMPANLAAMAQQGYAQQQARLAAMQQMAAQQSQNQNPNQQQQQHGQVGRPPNPNQNFSRPGGGGGGGQYMPTQGMQPGQINTQQLQAMQQQVAAGMGFQPGQQGQQGQQGQGAGRGGGVGGTGMTPFQFQAQQMAAMGMNPAHITNMANSIQQNMSNSPQSAGMGNMNMANMANMGNMGNMGAMGMQMNAQGRPMMIPPHLQAQQHQSIQTPPKQRKKRQAPAQQLLTPQSRPQSYAHTAETYRQQAMQAPVQSSQAGPSTSQAPHPPGTVAAGGPTQPLPGLMAPEIEPWADLLDEVDPREMASARFRARQEIMMEIFGPEPLKSIPLTDGDAWEGLGMDGETLEAKVMSLEKENEEMTDNVDTRLDEFKSRLKEIDENGVLPLLPAALNESESNSMMAVEAQ